MTRYALDTNVVSELVKPAPQPRIVAFLAGADDNFWVPAVVVYELEYGVAALPQGRRRNLLRARIDIILAAYADRILPLERTGAEWAARYRAQIRQDGGNPEAGNMLIAGIVRAHDLTLATRNRRHFAGLDIPLFNPWGNSADGDGGA